MIIHTSFRSMTGRSPGSHLHAAAIRIGACSFVVFVVVVLFVLVVIAVVNFVFSGSVSDARFLSAFPEVSCSGVSDSNSQTRTLSTSINCSVQLAVRTFPSVHPSVKMPPETMRYCGTCGMATFDDSCRTNFPSK